MESNKISKIVVFLCGASDFHAMDWYRTALKIIPDRNVVILTDLIAGEGYKKLINEEDKVYRLLIIDKLLFSAQSKIANILRNIIKLLIFPYQVYLLRTFSKSQIQNVVKIKICFARSRLFYEFTLRVFMLANSLVHPYPNK